ncbi:MAG: GDCCVxC domain-containing (seleno)protein [bacterium]|nr:GDCCVxC domain-containing (seleno)protein [bacterium]
MKQVKPKATLTCPKCGKEQLVDMPTDACQHFYKCTNCGEMLKPEGGDCCVFCSYADTKCPPKQLEENHDNDITNQV